MTAEDGSSYAFSNTHPVAEAHHKALSELYDARSIARTVREYGDVYGTRCLELGAGGGGYAIALARLLGPRGYVLATDIALNQIPQVPDLRPMALRLRQHELGVDPFPRGPWNIIHARLLLNHLPKRDAILTDMAANLAPGGLLITEDVYPHTVDDFLAYTRDAASSALLKRWYVTHAMALKDRGVQSAWALRAHRRMLGAGLGDVRSEYHGESWAGGSPGALWMAASTRQLSAHLLPHIAEWELSRVCHLLEAPDLIVMHGHRMVSVTGRRAPRYTPPW